MAGLHKESFGNDPSQKDNVFKNDRMSVTRVLETSKFQSPF